jgi:TonB family protein
MRMKIIAATVLAAFIAADNFLPARRTGGEAPPLPGPQTVGWIDETIDLSVDASGSVRDLKLLRGPRTGVGSTSSTFASWRFQPASDETGTVSSHVLVTVLMRPPESFDQPALGQPAIDLAPSNDELPYPTVMRRPRFPPNAQGSGVVLVELLIGVDGRVSSAAVVQGAPGFDREAMLTARDWVFRPARRAGEPVTSYAYVIFGFRQPVV